MTATPARPMAVGGQITDAILPGLPAGEAAALSVEAVVAAVGGDDRTGLSNPEVARRVTALGRNSLHGHRARARTVLLRQVTSPLLALLLVTAVVSAALGQRTEAGIIAAILAASVGLGFANDYRAERATEALHSRVRHTVVAVRDGLPTSVDVVELVPGDLVRLDLGTVVPADLRLLSVTGLECDESVLTGEPLPRPKSVDAVPAGTALADLSCIALMGTVVHAGAGLGVVVATGARTEFGRIAAGLSQRQPETEFQIGLRRFSLLLMRVALVLTTLIVVSNLLLHRSLLNSLLFSLAIAVGITPQLLPAVVSASLATGSRQLSRRKVLVKRLASIEDLGDLDLLVTDKTGTLTDGRISFIRGIDPAGRDDDRLGPLGLLPTDGGPASANALDAALWQAISSPPDGYTRLDSVPFDHQRRIASALVRTPDGGTMLVAKGAPEAILTRSREVPEAARASLDALFAAGSRVVAVATRPAADRASISIDDEHDLSLAGFLVFLDPVKPGAADSLRRLAGLGVDVKVATGDNPVVARKLCADLGLPVDRTLTGPELDRLDDDQLRAAARRVAIFARVSPEQKARLVRLLRHDGRAVGFLGDGVNDALALHQADVGISVDTATDVAKDAADIVLLDKSLDVLADGIGEGRRIFANTMKYVLMGTASNFGNMFSAAAASAVLPFLPMLPSQLLLNNLLYDSSQVVIPTDRVDPEQVSAPAHWDIALIRRFMLFFGPISSLFDFLTFGVMRGVLHAGPALFHSGWFVESLATQTLIIFAVRTRRVPFLRSRPGWPLAACILAIVAVGVTLPMSPLAGPLQFVAPPVSFYLVLASLILTYLIVVELAKKVFFAPPHRREQAGRRDATRRIQRRAARFSIGSGQR